MTATNPHPLANPLTDRPIGNVNWGRLAAGGGFRRLTPAQAAKTGLPDSTFSYQDYLDQQAALQVPNQDPAGNAGLLFNSLDLRGYGKVWDDKEIMTLQPSQDAQMSEQDRAYQLKSAEENARLSAEMTDFQKSLLSDIEDFVGQSQLIDESKTHTV